MNLFSSPSSKPETPPSIDQARQKVGEMKRGAGLRGRAASMLVQGNQAPQVAKREVTGS